MEPYDPPEARAASSYRWDGYGRQVKPSFNYKKFFYRLSWAVLVGAVLGLLYVNWYEAQIIVKQRDLIREMWFYIQNSCANPTSYTRF